MSKVPVGQKQGLAEVRLTRVQHGRELTRILTSCVGMTSDYPDGLSDEETGDVRNVLVGLQDFLQWEYTAELHVTMEFEQQLGEQLRVLNGYGFNVFLGTFFVTFTYGLRRRAAHVLVARSSDPKSQPDKSGNITALLVKHPEKYGGNESEASDDASPDESDEHYSLKRDGVRRDWRIVFEGGEEFFLRDMSGLRFLDYLLHHPHKPVECIELEKKADLSKDGMRLFTTTQLVSDPKAETAYKLRAVKLVHAIKEAKQREDFAAVKKDEDELYKIRDALKKAVGKWKSSMGGSGPERARNNVRKAIDRVCEALNKLGGPSGKAFAEHIGDSHNLKMGSSVIYSPHEKVIWK